MTTKPLVTIVTVTFNSSKVLQAMLATIPKGISVVVVDNASQDDSAAIAEEFGARVIRNKENLGFPRACNIGAAAADSEFLFFLNPDTELYDNTIDELIQAAYRYPNAAAFNPIITTRSGEPMSLRGSVIIPRPSFMHQSHLDSDCEILCLGGAAFFVSKKNFEKAGRFDENMFFGYCDDDISFRFQLKCGPLMSIYSANVMHLNRQSSAKTKAIIKLQTYHIRRGKLYLKQKYGLPFSPKLELCWRILKVLNGKLLFSERARIKHLAQLRAVWSIYKDRTLPPPRVVHNLVRIKFCYWLYLTVLTKSHLTTDRHEFIYSVNQSPA